MKESIRTENLTKTYRDICAVNNLSLTVYEGELFCLLGVNGAGKSTTVRLLSCLTAPTSGDAFLCGHSIRTEPRAVKSVIGLSPQETAAAPNLSVSENLCMMCGFHGFSKEKQKQKTAELSAQFGFAPLLSRKAGKLSGGWQRRLSIAMALACEPQILFLDEPTLGLDVLARQELWEILCAMKGKTTVILTTHYMEEAEALSDRIGIMRAGSLLAVGTAAEFRQKTGTDSLENAFIRIVREETI